MQRIDYVPVSLAVIGVLLVFVGGFLWPIGIACMATAVGFSMHDAVIATNRRRDMTRKREEG